jgi:hypothetical protein
MAVAVGALRLKPGRSWTPGGVARLLIREIFAKGLDNYIV